MLHKSLGTTLLKFLLLELRKELVAFHEYDVIIVKGSNPFGNKYVFSLKKFEKNI